MACRSLYDLAATNSNPQAQAGSHRTRAHRHTQAHVGTGQWLAVNAQGHTGTHGRPVSLLVPLLASVFFDTITHARARLASSPNFMCLAVPKRARARLAPQASGQSRAVPSRACAFFTRARLAAHSHSKARAVPKRAPMRSSRAQELPREARVFPSKDCNSFSRQSCTHVPRIRARLAACSWLGVGWECLNRARYAHATYRAREDSSSFARAAVRGRTA